MQKEMEADVKATADRTAELRLKVTQLQDEILALQVGCSFFMHSFFSRMIVLELAFIDSCRMSSSYLNAP